MEDQLIIKLFFERSEEAIRELNLKYGKICKRLANKFLHNEQDAEECINDAYLAVWNTIPPQNPNPFSAYVFRIVKNTALKKYRANTAQKRNNYYDVILEEVDEFLAVSETVESEILAKEIGNRINVFLGRIKDRDRIMFVQRYWFCYSVEEIAKTLGVSKNYVTVHLHRTREKLRDDLKSEGFYE